MMKKVLYIITLLIMVCCLTGCFDFSNGLQGWTMEGAYSPNVNGTYNHPFIFDWSGNWVGEYSGMNDAALSMFSYGGSVNIPGSSFWVMRFNSPDLSSLSEWQDAKGYVVQIWERMSVLKPLYANLFVVVYDLDQRRYRTFYDGEEAQVLPRMTETWLSLDWSAISSFPTNYIVKKVFINIWGHTRFAYEGSLLIDNVGPIY